MERARLTPFSEAPESSQASIVSSELLEITSREPVVHVVFIAGNPGVVFFYKDFVEALYNNLEGRASITAIGHISHSGKDLEHGKLFSLNEQIDHKVHFIEKKLQNTKCPIVLVGHSIGAYMCLEILKKCRQKIAFLIGLYPFITLNKTSKMQSLIVMVARSSLLSRAVSFFAAFVGSLPTPLSRAFVRRVIAPSWSVTAVDAFHNNLLHYHSIRNVLFMAMTEFAKLSGEPDWDFLRMNENHIAMLYGEEDHWGPLVHLDEVGKHAPGISLTVETEGCTHGFCCTEAGSTCVACYVANLIKNRVLNNEQ